MARRRVGTLPAFELLGAGRREVREKRAALLGKVLADAVVLVLVETFELGVAPTEGRGWVAVRLELDGTKTLLGPTEGGGPMVLVLGAVDFDCDPSEVRTRRAFSPLDCANAVRDERGASVLNLAAAPEGGGAISVDVLCGVS